MVDRAEEVRRGEEYVLMQGGRHGMTMAKLASFS
jgi:hypothetical protein